MGFRLPLPKPSRCVLLIGDEALAVYDVTASATRLVETVSWGTENFGSYVADLIVRACGKKPVLVLNDMVEQYYRKEKIPKVGLLDRASVVTRKLEITFPNYPIRSALPLKEKATASASSSASSSSGGRVVAGGAGGGQYLFAAVPSSDAFNRTMEAVRRSMAPLVGFCLLPVESSDMITLLAESLARKGRARFRWTVFIGQHRGGGLRQIVTRNGELALTRITPVIESDSDSALWASEVNQEFRATMSYLSRFGYAAEDGLDVVVISSSEAGAALGEMIKTTCHYTSLTVGEAARQLGLRIGRQQDDHLADSLHVAWAGLKSRFILPMRAQEVDKIYRPRQMAVVAMLAMLCGIGGMTYQMAGYGQQWMDLGEQISDAHSLRDRVEEDYQKESARKKAMGFDVDLVQGTIGTWDRLDAEGIHVLPLVRDIGLALAPNLSIEKISINRPSEKKDTTLSFGDKDGSEGKKSGYEVVFSMKFPPGIAPEEGVRAVDALVGKLRKRLPGDKVSVRKQVADLAYSAQFEGASTQIQDANEKKKEYEAEILIESSGGKAAEGAP